jgi:hypothetical protein
VRGKFVWREAGRLVRKAGGRGGRAWRFVRRLGGYARSTCSSDPLNSAFSSRRGPAPPAARPTSQWLETRRPAPLLQSCSHRLVWCVGAGGGAARSVLPGAVADHHRRAGGGGDDSGRGGAAGHVPYGGARVPTPLRRGVVHRGPSPRPLRESSAEVEAYNAKVTRQALPAHMYAEQALEVLQ